MKSINVSAPAKVNLHLNILGRRQDGYHEIETIFQTLTLFDKLNIRHADAKETAISIAVKAHSLKGYSDTRLPTDSRNIVWKATELLLQRAQIHRSVRITLHKNIPIQAGLGGGSSDAAALIKGLTASLKLPRLPNKDMAHKLGADVPFFLEGGCALATGIGEKIRAILPRPQFWAVVVKPEVNLPTPEVYRWYDRFHESSPRQSMKKNYSLSRSQKPLTTGPNIIKMRRFLIAGKSVRHWGPFVYNAFEEVVFSKVPELRQIKLRLLEEGAIVSSLSGSGSALFGIVNSKSDGERIKQKLSRSQLKIWVAHSN